MGASGDGDDERREYRRESIELAVRYQRLNVFFADYAKNISRGGTFVMTEEPLPENTEFAFSLGIPDLDEPLELRAKVMWTTSKERATKLHPAGMGIQFQYRDPEERQRLEGLIERLIVDQLGARHAERLLGRAAVPSAPRSERPDSERPDSIPANAPEPVPSDDTRAPDEPVREPAATERSAED
jgi:type IV pilus assembly protein PilZ